MVILLGFLVCHCGLAFKVAKYFNNVVSGANQTQFGARRGFAAAKKGNKPSIVLHVPKHRLDLGHSFFVFHFSFLSFQFLPHFITYTGQFKIVIE